MDLGTEIDTLEAQAHEDGAYGISTSRWFDPSKLTLPAGASWRTVWVRVRGALNAKAHQQPFSAAHERLCLHCLRPVPDCPKPPEAELSSPVYLFCSGRCEVNFSVKSSGSALRRELFKLEKGRCQMCCLDCDGLVRRLRLIREWRWADDLGGSISLGLEPQFAGDARLMQISFSIPFLKPSFIFVLFWSQFFFLVPMLIVVCCVATDVCSACKFCL